jgi:hypothetical protein
MKLSETTTVVITGLVPVIHVLLPGLGDKDVDGRVKPSHDEKKEYRKTTSHPIQPSSRNQR